jgi:hypothetical protein
MPVIKVLNGHTLSDLADESKLFEAADLNGIGITDALTPGVLLPVPERVPAKLFKESIPPALKPETIKSLYGQTWVDMAIQQLGDEARLFELCDLNDAGITDELLASTVVSAPEVEPEKKRIVNVLQKFKPACGKVSPPGEGGEGIEFWAIEYDFVVS